MSTSRVVDPDIVRVVLNGVDPARVAGAVPLDLEEVGLDPALARAAVVGLVYDAKGQGFAVEALARPELTGLQPAGPGRGGARGPGGGPRRGAARGLHGRARRCSPRAGSRGFPAPPSRWEAMPHVVLEAMAASRAVVATPADGARDPSRTSGPGSSRARRASTRWGRDERAFLAAPGAARISAARAASASTRRSRSSPWSPASTPSVQALEAAAR